MSNDDYLWDRSGEADPEIQRLEEALLPLRHRAAPPDLAASLPARPSGGRFWQRLVAAGVALAALGLLTTMLLRGRMAGDSGGQVVETGERPSTRIELGSIGMVEVGPRSRIRLVDPGETRYRLALDRGSLRAIVWAPPGAFQVETPSALAVDLGCVYTLAVDDAGDGVLTVESGWVAFEHRGRESFVPAGAQCATRRDRGPGIPYYLDAPPAFRQSLSTFEDLRADDARRTAGLADLLSLARPRDAMTLWHLLGRASGDERALIYDRMAMLSPPPPVVTRAGVLGGDRSMLDAWWGDLDLGSVEFWRAWKADWSELPRKR